MSYNTFEPGKPYLYEEIKAVANQTTFTLSKSITPSEDNPLYVFIDGVQTIYKSASGTTVELYVGCKEGQIVSFCSYGVPKVDPDWKRPSESYSGALPRAVIPQNTYYFYDPFSRRHQEYLYAAGQPLRRLNIPNEVWGATAGDVAAVTAIATKAIGHRTDVYTVSPGGSIFLPYNLNGVTCKFNYWIKKDGVFKMLSEPIKAVSTNPSYNDRFFPNAIITRTEAYYLINKLRSIFYSRFTDMDAPSGGINQTIIAFGGQRVLRLNGNYPAGEGKLEVRRNGHLLDLDDDYKEIDNHTVVMTFPLEEGDEITVFYEKVTSERFEDVGKSAGYYFPHNDTTKTWAADAWWAKAILDMEDETFNNGDHLINGIDIKKTQNGLAVVDKFGRPIGGTQSPETWFMPETAMTRAEAVAFLNRFRKWAIERFK